MIFKLLPKYEQDALQHEYRLRVAVVFFIFLFAVEIASAIFLLPSFVLSRIKDDKINEQYSNISKAHPNIDKVVLANEIKKARKQTADLAVSTTTVPVMSLMSRIIQSRSAAIRLTDIELVRPAGNGSSTIAVSGISANREALVNFQKSLESDKTFQKVELPVSELARNKDINFKINISGKF